MPVWKIVYAHFKRHRVITGCSFEWTIFLWRQQCCNSLWSFKLLIHFCMQFGQMFLQFFLCQLKKWKKNSFYEAEQVGRWMNNFSSISAILQHIVEFFSLMSNFCMEAEMITFKCQLKKWYCSFYKAAYFYLLVGKWTFFAQCQQSYKRLWSFNFSMESEMIAFSLLVGKVVV